MRPPLTYHLADIDEDGSVRAFRSSDRSDIWINGGYFILRPEIFDYMREGEELVLEPFSRLIAEDQLMAYRHEGFWRSMDTLQGSADPRGPGRAGRDALAQAFEASSMKREAVVV